MLYPSGRLGQWLQASQWGPAPGLFAGTARERAHSEGVSDRITRDPELLAAVFAATGGEAL